MNNKKLKVLLILIIILILTLANNTSKATDTSEKFMLTSANEKNISQEYKKWLALPDDEKSKYIMPSMYTININTKEDIEAGASNIPAKYSLKDTLTIPVRNQQMTNFCWAFSASKVFETTYAKLNNKTTLDILSPRHMAYSTSRYFKNNIENPTGFNREIDVGGNPLQAMAYYASGKGPVLEEDMPFVNSMEKIYISEIQNKVVKAQLEDATLFPNIYKNYSSNGNVTYSNGNGTTYSKTDIEKFREKIKLQIIKYGAIGSTTYMPTSSTDANYFSSGVNNCYYCDNKTLIPNHSITIVGWDDNFSKDNFNGKSKPTNDGAYLILNSYGENWGSNGGYYYISYDDYFIEQGMFGIQDVSDVDYKYIYQYDELGMNDALFNENAIVPLYAANCFTKKSSSTEKLSEVGLYIYNDNTDVTVYLNKNGKDLDINKLEVIATAKDLTIGYHVINLNNKITLGNNFSIIAKYSSNIGGYVPIECPVNINEFYNTASANSSESFVSFDGTEWKDITTITGFEKANACIKAFTINSTDSASDSDYIKNTNWKLVKGNTYIMLTGIEEKTTISELLSTNNFSSNYTVKAYKNGTQITTGNVTTGTVIKIYEGSTLIQEYTVVIYGDTTGDGGIASVDALTIVKNNLGKELFSSEIYEEAGRVLQSKRISGATPNAVDALACVKYKLGTGTISQR